jgi:L-rhamnonate dehydratase
MVSLFEEVDKFGGGSEKFRLTLMTIEFLVRSNNTVRAFVFGDDKQEKESGGGADCHKQQEGHWIVDSDIANPMSVYEQYRKSRTSWGIDAMGSVVVEVELSNGTIGVGISIGGDAACYIVEKHLARFVEGQDPTNVELIWDQCWRSTINYGRKGIAIQVRSLKGWDANIIFLSLVCVIIFCFSF